MKTLLAATVLLSAMSLSTAGRADDATACVDVAAKGRTLLEKHALAAAYAQFRLCAAPGCPAAVQAECAAELDAVEKNLPRVVLTSPPRPLVPPLPERPRYWSNGMRITGIVLTALSGAMLTGGVAALAWGSSQHCTGDCEDDFSGLGGALAGLGLMGGSLLFAGAGIPLWVVGGRSSDPEDARAAPRWTMPVVAAAGRTVTVRWSF